MSMLGSGLLWPMAYDAPCGGIGRRTRAPRCRGWHEVRVDERPTTSRSGVLVDMGPGPGAGGLWGVRVNS
eukprot:3055783-Prymnesium_polylepis.1